jgi:hypothetical protein
MAAGGSNAETVQERQPLLERFLRKVYQILVTEPLVHPLTHELYLILYNFLDLPDYLPAIESLTSLQSSAHGAYMNRLLHLTQDVTIEPSQLHLHTHSSSPIAPLPSESDPLLCTRRFIELYLHSLFQLNIFSTKLIEKYIHNFQFQCSKIDNRRRGKVFVREMLASLAEFINNVQEVFIVGMKDDISEIIEFLIHGDIQGRYLPSSQVSSSSLSSSLVDDSTSIDRIRLRSDIIETLSRIAIRRQLEKEIYIPCSSILHEVIQLSFDNDDQEILAKYKRLITQPQSFYGIPTHSLSPSSWEEVVNSLSCLRQQLIPVDKLQLLVTSAKLIPLVFSKEHPAVGTSGNQGLGADDLLPIFIFCLVRSQLSHHLLIIAQELESLCDEEDRVSETGYYLTTLQGALFHLMAIDENVGDRSS